MKTELLLSDVATIETELLVVFAADKNTDSKAKPQPALLHEDAALKAPPQTVLASGEFGASGNETVLLHAPANFKAKRLLVVGLGKSGEGDGARVAQSGRNGGSFCQAAHHSRTGDRGARRIRSRSTRGGDGRWSRAASSATSIPTCIVPTARTRASSRSRWSPDPRMPTRHACRSGISRRRDHRRIAELHPYPGQ